MTTTLTARFEEALIFAAHLHATQTRKGTEIPYIAHLMAVAGLVITHGGNEDEAIAALLHDAVEDQGGRPTLERIRAKFGDVVAAIVDGCSDTDVIPKPPFKPRKEAYLRHLKSASQSVKLVAAADKLDNVRAIVSDIRTHGPAVWSRFNAGPEDQKWFYRGCVTALQEGPASLVRELDLEVCEMESL
ncbi:MAG: HD domain-containing protein [Nitrospira sp. CR1.3]|nr:HD domain-containing protein [Nitrospira sp. CR1.3]